jgi:hypothetical protein
MQTTPTRSLSEVFAARKSLPQGIGLESGTPAIFIRELLAFGLPTQNDVMSNGIEW